MANPDNVDWTIRMACDVLYNPPATFKRETLLDAWQFIIDSGFVWELNDEFQRIAADLITSGICTPTKKFWRRSIPEDFPPEDLGREKEYKSNAVKNFIKAAHQFRERQYHEYYENRKKQGDAPQEPSGKNPGDGDSEH